MEKSDARIALEAAGISLKDPMIMAITPRLVKSALAAVAAMYAVLLLVKAVCCG